MWNIAICDSDKKFAEKFGEQVVRFYREKNLEVELKYFEDGNDFSEATEYPANLIFLNTRLADVDGYSLAAQLRRSRPNVFLVFLSDYDEDVYKAFSYRPFQYIRKAKWSEELVKVLQELWYEEHQKSAIRIQRKRGDLMIPVENIIYMESKGHYIHIHCNTEDYQVRDKLSNYEDRLKSLYFVHTSKSFLINCAYIESIGVAVRLKNGKEMTCSKSRRQEAEKILQKYLEEIVYFI